MASEGENVRQSQTSVTQFLRAGPLNCCYHLLIIRMLLMYSYAIGDCLISVVKESLDLFGEWKSQQKLKRFEPTLKLFSNPLPFKELGCTGLTNRYSRHVHFHSIVLYYQMQSVDIEECPCVFDWWIAKRNEWKVLERMMESYWTHIAAYTIWSCCVCVCV